MQVLTAERLRAALRYDSATGVFTWLVQLSNKGPVGAIAGSSDKNGYVNIGIDGRDYKAHRLAWLWMLGVWPATDIDHRNRTPSDNRWDNLRTLAHAVNTQNVRKARSNNGTGLLGVSRSGTRFKAQIMLNGKQRNLGRYSTAEAAHEVYLSAKQKLHIGFEL